MQNGNEILFYQAIHELKRVLEIIQKNGLEKAESHEHWLDDMAEVNAMIEGVTFLKDIYGK